MKYQEHNTKKALEQIEVAVEVIANRLKISAEDVVNILGKIQDSYIDQIDLSKYQLGDREDEA